MIVGLLMAVGRSRRFGSADKLLAPLHGKPLVTHAAAALLSVATRAIAVTTNSSVAAALPPSFEIICQTNRNTGLGDNIALGSQNIELCKDLRLLIVLGDMPFVEPGHLYRLAHATTAIWPAASKIKGRLCVPACFPSLWVPKLQMLVGDVGMGHALQTIPLEQGIDLAQPEDVDTLTDLGRFNRARQRPMVPWN